MSTSKDNTPQVPQVQPQVVREIAQSKPEPGDFREQFPKDQPAVAEFLEALSEDSGTATAEFSKRVAAALWAMYEYTLDAPLPPIEGPLLSRLRPVAGELLSSLSKRHPEEEFDAEWLTELPKGAQPHLMGFLIGALRAARVSLSGAEILEAATSLFTIAGALEVAATRALELRSTPPDLSVN